MLAVGATPGEAYEALDWGEAWPFNQEAMAAYREQRYADAADAMRRGLEQLPDNPGLNYNYACFARRSRARPATRRSPTSGAASSSSRRSAKWRAPTRTSPPYAATRGSTRRFADGPVTAPELDAAA